MTRINTVPVRSLTDQHLLAEYRELPRAIKLARPLGVKERVERYTLGTGHVRFFFERTGYLHQRQRELIAECIRRGFRVQFTEPPAPVPGLDADWTPDSTDVEINLVRLRDRLAARPGFYTYCGRPVGRDHYGELA